MEASFFQPNHPIVLGLHGKALTGKTVTGDAIAPKGYIPDPSKSSIQWDHLFFAIPLYRMATARQKISGIDAEDRILYEIHSELLDILGRSPLFGAPPYEYLINLVQKIASLPMPEGQKPRTFLQESGSMCRAWDKDCFVNWIKRMVASSFSLFLKEQQKEDQEEYVTSNNSFAGFGVILSDIRYQNEAQYVKDQPNGILIELTATEEVRQERSLNRDGHLLTISQNNHSSETQTIPQDWFTASIDTSELSIKEQVLTVLDIVYSNLKGIPKNEQN